MKNTEAAFPRRQQRASKSEQGRSPSCVQTNWSDGLFQVDIPYANRSLNQHAQLTPFSDFQHRHTALQIPQLCTQGAPPAGEVLKDSRRF